MPQRPDVLQSIWTVFQQLLRYPNRYISRMYVVYLYLDLFWLISLIVWWNSGLATGDTKRLLRWVLLAISGGMTKPHRSWIWDSKTTGVPTMKYIISNRKLGWLHHEHAQNFAQHLSVSSQKCLLSHFIKGSSRPAPRPTTHLIPGRHVNSKHGIPTNPSWPRSQHLPWLTPEEVTAWESVINHHSSPWLKSH